MIKTICYISDSVEHKSIEKLKKLYLKAKKNNHELNITGVLIYKNKNFLQVLEGDVSSVNTTFEKIKFDKRHRNIFEVINTTTDVRIFQDYNFGFTIVDNKEGIKNLHEYLEWLKVAENQLANEVITMVENFLEKL